MTSLPAALYSAQQTRALDQLAMDKYHMPGIRLMEAAGEFGYRVMRFRWPRARKIAVICGPGNNGGDGYVLARLAQEMGLNVTALHINDPNKLKGDAQLAYKAFVLAKGQSLSFTRQNLASAEIIVDALFGTGLERDIADQWFDCVHAINETHCPVLTLDIPSGLHADSGHILGNAVRASVTVSFVGLNVGLFLGQGPTLSGEVYFSDLDIPAEAASSISPVAERVTQHSLAGLLKSRARDTHKRDYGQVLVIGGAPGMSGAAIMSALGAYRSGAGLVKVATHPAHSPCLGDSYPELMIQAVDRGKELRALMAASDVVALGPGLGQDKWAQALFATAMETSLPMVVDADGLNLLALNSARRQNWILTPHPGEAARLLGIATRDVQSDRLAAVKAIAKQYGGVCVLKGANTLIASSEKTVIGLCDSGNPGMASAGMGDVLTGVIAGLLAQGLSLDAAGRLSVWAHASAGDVVRQRLGEQGLMATDVLSELSGQLALTGVL